MSPETTETKPQQPEAHTHDHAHDHEHDHAGHDHSHDHGPSMNEACKREVSIEIPADIVSKLQEKTIKKYQKFAKIPGFRAGKVPVTIIKNRFMEDVNQEVVESLVPQYFRAEVERQGLLPVSQPRVTDLHLHEGEPMKFKAVFEVLPEINPKGYKDLKAEKKDIAVTDAEVNEALQHLQQQQASYENVDDRELKDGDFAQVSFTGLSKGTKKIADAKAGAAEAKGEAAPEPTPDQKPVEVKDVLVEIGGSNTVKEFTENLRGMKPGESKTFDVTYADDFNDQRLAGQVMTYTVNVQSLKKKTVPELNDDFAKELGEFATLDELKTRIRENMEAEKKHDYQHKEKERLIDELVAANDFPVPQALIDRQIETRLERGFRALAQQGMRAEDMRKLNFERLRTAQTPAAVREVKASLLLDKIAEIEKIDVSEDDLNKELVAAAQQYQQPVEVIRERLSKDGTLERIKDRLRNEKALDFLFQQSA